MAPATLKKLQKELKPVLDASPYDIEIALQDGGHRWVARIFWPHAKYPELLWDNPEQEIRSIEKGRMCIEYRLCNVDQPTYEDLHFSGCDFWGDMRAALENYLLYLHGEDPDTGTPPSAPPMKKSGQTVTFTGVRRMIKKVVKAQGTSGRLYVPPEEVGNEAIIIFLDED